MKMSLHRRFTGAKPEKLPRGFARRRLTLEDVRSLSLELAEQIASSPFQPTAVVGIKYGGAVIGRIVAKQLALPFHGIYVKRKPVIYIDDLVHKYPWFFRKPCVAWVTRYLTSVVYALSAPVVIEPLQGSLPANARVLLIDDSIGKGPTSQVARRHLIHTGILSGNISVGVIQVHPEFAGESPDFFLLEDNARFPWDKASIVEGGENPRLTHIPNL